MTLEFYGHEKCVINKVLHGGMGTVYQIVPLRSVPPLGLKTFSSHVDRKSFERECEIWLALTTHPRIARAHFYGVWRGQPAILMDWYTQNATEARIMDWPDRDILAFVKGLVEALNYGYAKTQLVHQDIKPSNILLDDKRLPYLADFGIARCALPSAPALSQLMNLKADMNQTGAGGHVGGTPIYMAPELFAGANPSVQTDMFSLGVTLYQVLTNELPFIGAETGGRFKPKVRMPPLDRVLMQRGAEIAVLIEIIVDCLFLDAMQRPPNYAGILRRLGVRGQERQPVDNEDSVSAVVAQAALYRQQSRHFDADRLLQHHLQTDPDDPVLLNALGTLRISEGKQREGSAAFKRATDVLTRHKGQWRCQPYPDPIVNLANQARNHQLYQEASDLLEKAWSWLDGKQRPELGFWYTEFGWLWLYRGQFARCTEYMLQVLKHKNPDSASLKWLMESAWLAGQVVDVAPTLGRILVELRPTDLQTILCACLVAADAPANLRKQLLDLTKGKSAVEIALIEQEMNFPIGGLRPPFDRDAEKFIVRSIDQSCTGGKHNALVG